MKKIILFFFAATMSIFAHAEKVGEVNTTVNVMAPNDKIIVDVFDDPVVRGVSCYLSHAKTGSLLSVVGADEDTSDGSVACRQIGPISFVKKLPAKEDVFTVKTSAFFKKMHVVRMVDKARNTLVYLVYSDYLNDGSPKNSVTAVPVPASTPIPLN